jgi:murein DD-endopeptidase MepM/ murein hydrolase activator NlpD
LKRALKNKLKAVLDNTTSGEDAPVEYLNMNEPRESRGKRTRAAMILALSMGVGTSSLLVTRQNDQALAAEPVGNQNTASTFSAVPDSQVSFASTNSLDSQAPTPVTVVASKSVVEPTAVSQVPGLGSNWQVATSGVQVPTPYNVSVPQQFQSVSGVSIPSVSPQEQGTSKLSETLSNAKKTNVALNQTAPQAAVNPTVGVSASKESEVNLQLKAQQEFALGHLKEKSSRLRDSLAEFRGSEGQKSVEVATQIAAQPTTDTTSVIQTAPQQSETNQVSSSTTELLSRLKRNNVASATASILTPAPASGVLPAATTAYEVKSGDTLASIARNQGISVSELVKVNNLTNANSLKVNQKLTIPVNETISAVNLNTQETAIVPQLSTSPTDTAATNPVKPVVANSQVIIKNQPTNINFNGIGGDTPVPLAFADTQIAKAQPGSKVKRKSPYVRNLQEEIEKLRDKYRAQQSGNASGNVVVPVVSSPNDTTSVAIPVPRASQSPVSVPIPVYGRQQNTQVRPSVSAKEPINPDFQNNSVRIAVPPASRDASGSLGNMRGIAVSPQLPPLTGVDKYLPSSVEDNTPLTPGVMPGSTGTTTAFIWPAKAVLTSGYGWRWGRMHKGVDLAGPVGTPIYAAADGVIEKAGWNNGGYGYLVEIRHADGTMTRYGHNSKLLVQQGQQVHQGQQVSNMGSTGFSTGPHLHFEIHPSGKGAVNPIAFLPPRV